MTAQQKPVRGFSLTELMVAIAIAGILGAIALPAYQDHMTRSRRAMGQQGLMEIAAAMQLCAMQPPASSADSYDECADGANKPLARYYSTDTDVHPALLYYDFTISAADASAKFDNIEASYVLIATPKNAQAGDGELRLYSDGRRAWKVGATFKAWDN